LELVLIEFSLFYTSNYAYVIGGGKTIVFIELNKYDCICKKKFRFLGIQKTLFMSHFIPLTEAAEMTAVYRNHRETILRDEYRNQALLPLSETFDRAAFDSLLAKSGCTALRVYYGMKEDLKVHAVIVGVDAEGKDMLPSSLAATGGSTEEDIIDNSLRCPDICPDPSPLNS